MNDFSEAQSAHFLNRPEEMSYFTREARERQKQAVAAAIEHAKKALTGTPVVDEQGCITMITELERDGFLDIALQAQAEVTPTLLENGTYALELNDPLTPSRMNEILRVGTPIREYLNRLEQASEAASALDTNYKMRAIPIVNLSPQPDEIAFVAHLLRHMTPAASFLHAGQPAIEQINTVCTKDAQYNRVTTISSKVSICFPPILGAEGVYLGVQRNAPATVLLRQGRQLQLPASVRASIAFDEFKGRKTGFFMNI